MKCRRSPPADLARRSFKQPQSTFCLLIPSNLVHCEAIGSKLARQLDEKGPSMKKPNKKQKKQIASIAAKKDVDIDLTDMPEVLDWSKAEIGKFYRPPKKPVTIRLDTDIISWLKSYGRGYQTKTNMLLRHAMKSSIRAKSSKGRSA